MTAPLIWALTDDRPGTAAQVLGVAAALGLPFVEKRLGYSGLARLPNVVRGAGLTGIDDASRARIVAPWPDVVIGAGRRSAPVARWIKAQGRHHAGKPVRIVHLMNPGRVGAGDFDLIVLPHHDCTPPGGDAVNILRITGAPHRITDATLAQAAAKWQPAFAHLPRPYIALLVGGATNRKPFPTVIAHDLGARTAAMARGIGGTVLLATSRRTGAEAEQALTAAMSGPHASYVWGQGGDNPYMGFLALADAIVVTGDSVSMCSEACATGKAVFIAAPDAITAPKHRRLHQELYAKGYARTFDGSYAAWMHAPLNAAVEVADAVKRLWN
jgi:mitochondrial fission protein ELM1